MPKKVTPKPAVMGKQPKKKTSRHAGPALPTENPLSLDERTELKNIYGNEVFRKGFSNARLMRPTLFPPGLSTPLGPQIALLQLARLQGWEMFEAALAVQVKDKLPPKEPLTETYNDPDMPPVK